MHHYSARKTMTKLFIQDKIKKSGLKSKEVYQKLKTSRQNVHHFLNKPRLPLHQVMRELCVVLKIEVCELENVVLNDIAAKKTTLNKTPELGHFQLTHISEVKLIELCRKSPGLAYKLIQVAEVFSVQ